jgi:hypothetical protein
MLKQQVQKPIQQPGQQQVQKPIQQQVQKPIQQQQVQKPIQQQVQKQVSQIINNNNKVNNNNQQARILSTRQPLIRKVSQKVINKQKNKPDLVIKQQKSIKSLPKSQKVNFNLKNNQVQKFYCPQLAVTKLTKTNPIDLGSIPDLPEIPLDSLLDIH